MTGRLDNGLRLYNFAANGAVRTLGLAVCGAGRGYGAVYNLGVTCCGDSFCVGVAAVAFECLDSLFRASRLFGDRGGVGMNVAGVIVVMNFSDSQSFIIISYFDICPIICRTRVIYIFKVCTVVKCIIFNCCNAIGYCYASQICTLIKCIMFNCCDAIRYC